MNIFSKAGEALLLRFMPKTQAEAACPPETLYHYKCIGTSQYRETCQVQSNCTTKCGPWVRIGSCPV